MSYFSRNLRTGLAFAVIMVTAIGLAGNARAAQGETLVAGADPQFAELIARCAPTVSPVTMAAIVSTESRGRQFAIADAGPVALPWSERKKLVRSYYLGSASEATAMAEALIANGHTVSLGLSQVNDRNLSRLGVTVRQMFDPCANLGAGGRIITEFYKRASIKFGAGTRALNAALSAYNSGDWLRGEREGYVNQIYKQQGRRLALSSDASGGLVPSISASPKTMLVASIGSTATADDGGRKFGLSAADFAVDR